MCECCFHLYAYVYSNVFLRCGNEEALFGFAKRKQFSFRMKQWQKTNQAIVRVGVHV